MPVVPGCLRWLPWIALAFVPASGGAAPSTCAEYEAMGQALAQSRDSDPAAGVEKGTAALAGARALVPACPGGVAMVLGGIATNLHMLGRSTEALAHYDEALATLGEGGTPTQRAFLHRGIGVVQF